MDTFEAKVTNLQERIEANDRSKGAKRRASARVTKGVHTPVKIPPTVYDHLINRFVWLQRILTNLYDVTPSDGLDDEVETRIWQAEKEKREIGELLTAVQAKGLPHAFLQALFVGSELSNLAYSLQCVIDKMPHGSDERLELYQVRDRLKVFDLAQWSALEVFKKLPEVKGTLRILDDYRASPSPFSDTGKYSELEPPTQEKAA